MLDNSSVACEIAGAMTEESWWGEGCFLHNWGKRWQKILVLEHYFYPWFLRHSFIFLLASPITGLEKKKNHLEVDGKEVSVVVMPAPNGFSQQKHTIWLDLVIQGSLVGESYLQRSFEIGLGPWDARSMAGTKQTYIKETRRLLTSSHRTANLRWGRVSSIAYPLWRSGSRWAQRCV